jgi:hypothetical protein
MKLVRRPKGPFGLVDRVHDLQSALAKAWGRPTSGMLTDLELDGRPVIFLHNPKTAGKSLRRFLHVKRHSHSTASARLSPKHWHGTFSIVAVRHPFERFLSGYYDRVRGPDMNGHVKLYGPEFKKISPFEFLEVIKESPRFSGRQVQWTDYPSAEKPRADLILRHETIGTWKDQMLAAGLAVADRELPHLNRSARAGSDHLEQLKLTAAEFARLELAVKDHFRCDYEAFGYPL